VTTEINTPIKPNDNNKEHDFCIHSVRSTMKIHRGKKKQKRKSTNASCVYFWIRAYGYLLLALWAVLYFTIFHNKHEPLYNEGQKYFKPGCG
jgi:hypothetical protein